MHHQLRGAGAAEANMILGTWQRAIGARAGRAKATMSCLRQPTAGQLRYQMNGVADIVCAPDRSVNAVVERVPATLLHEESWWAVWKSSGTSVCLMPH